MELKKGISVSNKLSQQQEALAINSGVIYAAQETIPEVNFMNMRFTPRFQHGAILAKPDWRPLSLQDQHMLNPKGAVMDFNTVFLGDLPESLIRQFKGINLLDAKRVEDIYQAFRQNEGLAKELNIALNNFLSSISNHTSYKFHCFGVSYPNLLSVSGQFSHLLKNHAPTEVEYIGLHNDFHGKKSIHKAHTFGNRISINIGKEAREFLFGNLSLIQAYNMIRLKKPEVLSSITLSNMPEVFFGLFPDYPILMVRLQPYQYYIAPTENCFHDGRTIGNNTLDMTMVFFGHFMS